MGERDGAGGLRPAQRPTMYFIGVTTGSSSIMRIFPHWAALLGLGDCDLAGIDLPLHAPPERYHEVVDFIAADPLSLGALVTTHKLDLYAACRERLDLGDEFAGFMHEASCLVKRDGRLVCHAKDPLTAGLSLRGLLPDGHWTGGSAALVLGAGGAGTAVAWHLLDPARGADRPRRLVVTDPRPDRLTAVAQLSSRTGPDVPMETVEAHGTTGNDAALCRLPPGSLVVNATGLGKDRPGSPLSGAADFPDRGIAWDLNYRGDLVFLDQARAAGRGVRVEDGWTYFLHGWSQHIAEVFRLDQATVVARFDELSAVAARWRPGTGGG
jgi:shikimate 5-dehydrogenase